MVEVALDREDGGQKTSVNGRGYISMRQQVEQNTDADGKSVLRAATLLVEDGTRRRRR